MSDVDRIKERLNILDVVSQYVKLEKAGKHYKGLSPFSSENTPSFFVSPDKGLYHCFSTGQGGDVFTFIQEVEGLDFAGSLKFLADQAGIKLEGYDPKKKEEKDQLYDALEIATEFFRERLAENEEARGYVENRGIDDKSSLVFRIGYAPDEWHALEKYLKERGVKEADAYKAGLLKRSDRGYYDLFRDRIIFPIRDAAGRVVGFSGRILHPTEKAPKYVNTPETPLFHKSRILYGYYRARQAMRKNDFCILVEGQVDLVLSHQAGFPTTVAASGTALTQDHLKLISRYTDNLLLVFDNDKAGWASMLKSSLLALPLGMNVKTIILPEGTDPADVITGDDAEWKSYVRSATHVIEATTERIISAEGDRERQWRAVERTVLPLIKALPNAIERAHFISLVSEKTGIPSHSIEEQLGKRVASPREVKEVKERKEQKTSRTRKLVEEIAGVIAWKEDDADFDTAKYQEKLDELGHLAGVELDEKDIRKALFQAATVYSAHSTIDDALEGLIYELEEVLLRTELKQLSDEARRWEGQGDDEKHEEALQEIDKLSTELQSLLEKK
ncbi:MAG: DNA primase [Candidatus Paceibacterota bacterium]